MDARITLWLDSVADLRAAGGGRTPDPVAVALLAELAGVDAIALSYPEDRRDDRERDVRVLRDTVKTRLDLGLVPSADLVSTAFEVHPDRVTLIPDPRDGRSLGVDAHLLKDALRRHINHLKDASLQVAVRVEPGLEQIKALHRVDADAVVLTADAYLQAEGAARRNELVRLSDAATLAARLGLTVALWGVYEPRDLEQLARIGAVTEFHLGHNCVALGLLRGVEAAVSDFATALRRGRARAV